MRCRGKALVVLALALVLLVVFALGCVKKTPEAPPEVPPEAQAEKPTPVQEQPEAEEQPAPTTVEKAPQRKPMFFDVSLHATTRGMRVIFEEGVGKLTGLDYYQVGCYNCHAVCDSCHAKDGSYSVAKARNVSTCLQCHGREGLVLVKMKLPDVHFSKGFKCMDCHTARDLHGDGKEYRTMKEPGALSVSCENCHYEGSDKAPAPPNTTPHKVHGRKLDCKACHVKSVITCYNCHLETLEKYHEKIAYPTKDWLFLVNYNGKVYPANVMTVVYKNTTFAIFAPQFPHYVVAEGRQCGECHGNENVKDLAEDKEITLTWWDGELKHKTGVIPVLDPKEYRYVFQFLDLDFNPTTKEKKWSPLEGAKEPVVIVGNFGEPLTEEQFEKLQMEMG